MRGPAPEGVGEMRLGLGDKELSIELRTKEHAVSPENNPLTKRHEEIDRAQAYMAPTHNDWLIFRQYLQPDTPARGEGGQKERLLARMGDKDRDLYGDQAVVANHLFAIRETTVARLLGALPGPVVVGAPDEVTEAGSELSAYLQAWALWQGVEEQLRQAFNDAVEVGLGVVEVYWDKNLDDVRLAAVDPAQLYFDPAALALEECSFVALRNVYSEALAEELWPDTDLEKTTHVSGGGDGQDISAQEDRSGERGPMIEVWQHYYHFGRRLTVYSGEQVLYDGDNPTPGGRYPFFLFQTLKSSRRFLGESIVAYLWGLQDEANSMRTRLGIAGRFASALMFHGNDPSQEDTEIEPGKYFFHQPGTEFGALPALQLSPAMLELVGLATAAMDEVSGSTDASRGNRQRGVNSGILAEFLQQKADERLAGPARTWIAELREAYQCALEIMQRSYTEGRHLPMASEGQARWTGVKPEQLSSMEPTGRPSVDDQGEPVIAAGQPVPEMEQQPRALYVVMEAVASFPHSPMALFEMLQGACTIGLINLHDPLERAWALNLTRFPGRQQIIDSLEKQAAAQMEGQQHAAALQAGQEAPPAAPPQAIEPPPVAQAPPPVPGAAA